MHRLSEDTNFTKDEIRWAIDQCERQGEGVDAVLPFLEGWEYARQTFVVSNRPTVANAHAVVASSCALKLPMRHAAILANVANSCASD